jgi:hypothetical protein
MDDKNAKLFESKRFKYDTQIADRYKFKYDGHTIKGRTRPKLEEYLLDMFIKDFSGLMTHEDMYYTTINWEDYDNTLKNLHRQELTPFSHFNLFEKFINNTSVSYIQEVYNKAKEEMSEVVKHVDFIIKPTLITTIYAKLKEVVYKEDYVKFDNMLYNRRDMKFENSDILDHFHEIPHDFINAEINLNYNPDHKYIISDKKLKSKDYEGENFALHWLNSSFKDPVFNKVVMGYELLNLKLYDKAVFNVGIEGSGKSIKSAVIKALCKNNGSVNFEKMKDETLMLKMLRSRHLAINEVKGNKNTRGFEDLTSQLKTYISRSDTITGRSAYQRESDIKPIEEKAFINLYGNETFSSFDEVLKKKFWLVEPARQFRDTPMDIPNLEKLICEDQLQLNIVVDECINTFLSNGKLLDDYDVAASLKKFNDSDSSDPHTKWVMDNIDFVGHYEKYENIYPEFLAKWKEYLDSGIRIDIDDMPHLTIPDAKEDYKKFLKKISKTEADNEIDKFFQRSFSKLLKKCFPDAYGRHSINSYQIDSKTKGRLFFMLKKDIKKLDNDKKEKYILDYDIWKNKQDDLENFDNEFEIWNYYLKINDIPVDDEISEILNDLEVNRR